jgi:hypothetical protein
MTVITLAACSVIVLPALADEPGAGKADAIVRELVGHLDTLNRDQIARQVDFSNEYLLYFQWTGVADDTLEATAEEGLGVVFHFTPGHCKNKEMHERVFAVRTTSQWRLVETARSSRTPGATRISDARDLEKTLPAPKPDPNPEQTKRIAEVQKEIGELRARLATLSAELARLQPAPERRPPKVSFQGTITRLNDKTEPGFLLEWREAPRGHPKWKIILLQNDTQILYSDDRAAKPSDLKSGLHVNVCATIANPSDAERAEADVVVIERAARWIPEEKDANEIAKQVDFASEYLLWFRIEGVADDDLPFTVSRDRDGVVVHFTFYRGIAKGPDGHILSRFFAIANDARVTGYAAGTKITSAKELAKALQERK